MINKTPGKSFYDFLIPVQVGQKNSPGVAGYVWKFKTFLIALCFVSGWKCRCCKFIHTKNLLHFRSEYNKNFEKFGLIPFL